MHWAEHYVGLPYSDADCAELAAKVQREIFNKVIPMPSDRAENVHGLSHQIVKYQPDIAVQIDKPEEGCAVLMVGRGRLNHVGIFCSINNSDYVLHAMRSVKQTVLHRLSELPNQGFSVEGFYQWI